MDTVPKREKIPQSRLPIIPANVSLYAKPPAPGPKVHTRATRPPPPRPPPPPVVSLTQPTPLEHRPGNHYIETPHHPSRIDSINGSDVISSQPEPWKAPESDACPESIICRDCERCKCARCATPKELPRKWLRGNTEISMQCAIETCTCLCCVKLMFDTLDIRDKEHDTPLSDVACSCCEEPHCCQRWTCMGLLSLCLPCLCLYPFLKCGLNLCTKCYDRVTRKGCTCRASNAPGSKRLLIEHENSSST